MWTDLANHLWESTLFVCVVWVLTVLLRRNRAGVRHALWVAASLKFLLPFVGLIWLGQQIPWRPAFTHVESGAPIYVVALARETVSQGAIVFRRSLTASAPRDSVWPTLVTLVWAIGALGLFARWGGQWLAIRRLVQSAIPSNGQREARRLRQIERQLALSTPLAMAMTSSPLEPGVFGVRRPILLWPRGLGARLTDVQLDAILIHELAHVRRRDNLAAALHALVQALFWFHPAVWWIAARLVDERERACDEQVIRLGSERETYAESLLTTCLHSIEAPVCVAGVTGADLKRRVESIMTGGHTVALGTVQRILLATLSVGAVVVPLLIGVLSPRVEARRFELRRVARPQVPADPSSFEVASIRPNASAGGDTTMQIQPGGRLTITNASLMRIMQNAFRLPERQILGGPEWIRTDRFDIVAKVEGDPAPDTMAVLLRRLIVDRFSLVTHDERRELAVYELKPLRTDGKLGDQLHTAAGGCQPLTPRPRAPGEPPSCGFRLGPGRIEGTGVTLGALAYSLGTRVDRAVVDRTALSGTFDLSLNWSPEAAVTDGPSLFTAVREQLGLKLETARAPLDVIVVDRAERPSPD